MPFHSDITRNVGHHKAPCLTFGARERSLYNQLTVALESIPSRSDPEVNNTGPEKQILPVLNKTVLCPGENEMDLQEPRKMEDFLTLLTGRTDAVETAQILRAFIRDFNMHSPLGREVMYRMVQTFDSRGLRAMHQLTRRLQQDGLIVKDDGIHDVPLKHQILLLMASLVKSKKANMQEMETAVLHLEQILPPAKMMGPEHPEHGKSVPAGVSEITSFQKKKTRLIYSQLFLQSLQYALAGNNNDLPQTGMKPMFSSGMFSQMMDEIFQAVQAMKQAKIIRHTQIFQSTLEGVTAEHKDTAMLGAISTNLLRLSPTLENFKTRMQQCRDAVSALSRNPERETETLRLYQGIKTGPQLDDALSMLHEFEAMQGPVSFLTDFLLRNQTLSHPYPTTYIRKHLPKLLEIHQRNQSAGILDTLKLYFENMAKIPLKSIRFDTPRDTITIPVKRPKENDFGGSFINLLDQMAQIHRCLPNELTSDDKLKLVSRIYLANPDETPFPTVLSHVQTLFGPQKGSLYEDGKYTAIYDYLKTLKARQRKEAEALAQN